MIHLGLNNFFCKKKIPEEASRDREKQLIFLYFKKNQIVNGSGLVLYWRFMLSPIPYQKVFGPIMTIISHVEELDIIQGLVWLFKTLKLFFFFLSQNFFLEKFIFSLFCYFFQNYHFTITISKFSHLIIIHFKITISKYKITISKYQSNEFR